MNYYSKEICSVCNSHLIITETPTTPHYARLDCPKCKKWVKWLPNPNQIKQKQNRRNKSVVIDVCKFQGFKEEFCFICLRERKQLGTYETLTIDHIKELDKGGEDKIQNMQILCSACHKLKNWCRLYMNWHFKGEEDDTKTITK